MAISSNSIIVILIGLIIYYFRPKWVILYYLILSPLFLPFFANRVSIETIEDLSSLNSGIRQGGAWLIYILIAFKLLRHWEIPQLGVVYYGCLTLTIYMLFFSMIHSVVHIEFGLANIATLMLLVLDRNLLPSFRTIRIFVVFIIAYELIWCVLNLNGIYALKVYESGGVGYVNQLGERITLVSGTFRRFNDMSNFFTTIYLLICIEYFYYSKITSRYFTIVSVCILAIVLLSGSRTSMLLFVFSILGCLFIKSYNSSSKHLGSVSLLSFLTLAIFSITDNSIGKGAFSGVERIIAQLTSIVQAKTINTETTLSLSGYLLSRFFFESPFLGNGLAHLGDYAYGKITTVALFRSDARLAFILVEYGIIGLAAYLTLYFSIFKQVHWLSKIPVKIVVVVFLYFLFLTTNENGFFDNTLITMFIIYAFAIAKEKKVLNINLRKVS